MRLFGYNDGQRAIPHSYNQLLRTNIFIKRSVAARYLHDPSMEKHCIRNLVSTNSKDAAITLQGLPEMPIQNLTFANASFAGSKNFSIAHAHGVNFFNTTYNGASTGLASSPVDATIHQLTITGQPKSQSINVGSPLTLTVAATADFTPIFQWYSDGLSLGNSFGAISASLVLSAVPAECGKLFGFVGRQRGSILSDSAIILVKGGDAVLRNFSVTIDRPNAIQQSNIGVLSIHQVVSFQALLRREKNQRGFTYHGIIRENGLRMSASVTE